MGAAHQEPGGAETVFDLIGVNRNAFNDAPLLSGADRLDCFLPG